jgi:shikimate kinase
MASRTLITGMSGTGKSTVITELSSRGFRAIDTDSDAWCRWITLPGEQPQDWIWREDRMNDLLTSANAKPLFVAGCKSNQVKFYNRFEHIVLLSAPEEVIVERIANRHNNPYGKDPWELEAVLHNLETVEPLLRQSATLEISTRVPIDEVVNRILDHAGATRAG